MKRFVEGEDRRQATLLPECTDDYVSEENPVRVIDAFVAALDLAELGFEGVVPERTGRPAYHPATLLKLYIYGYVNRVQSSRRLEREAGRNLELMWLTGRLAPRRQVVEQLRPAATEPGRAGSQQGQRGERRGRGQHGGPAHQPAEAVPQQVQRLSGL